MKLEDIGFYTLCTNRAKNTSITSLLYRCELILTDKCNFRCLYCRGLADNQRGDIPFLQAMKTLRLWCEQGLKNVRFSGGEPMTYSRLPELVAYCAKNDVEHIAVSTNGSYKFEAYEALIDNGVNDFSISLDGGCCAVGDKMSGISGSWNLVVDNIRKLSKLTYVTVGMVFTEENVDQCLESVLFADSLGVSDIRVIPSAQYDQALFKLRKLSYQVLKKYPILRYRINNMMKGKHVRGIKDNRWKCMLAMDDMVVVQDQHYPCVIHMREGGKPIGTVGEHMRQDRALWIEEHEPWNDPICKKDCLDVCQDYNKVANFII